MKLKRLPAAVHTAAFHAGVPPRRRGFFSSKPQPAAVPNPPPKVFCDRTLDSSAGARLLRLIPGARP